MCSDNHPNKNGLSSSAAAADPLSTLQADLLTRKRVIVEAVRQMPRMMPRSTCTSHSLAPGYVPATMATMARSIQALKAVWRQRNSLVGDAIRQAHRLALVSMHEEVVHRVAVLYNARMRARAAAATVAADNAEAQAGALRRRVAEVRKGKARGTAALAARDRARGVGASLVAEARAVRQSERYAAVKEQHARQKAAARERWYGQLAAQEDKDAAKVEGLRAKQAAAAALRASGYTPAAHQAHVEHLQELCENAATARLALLQGRAMVGPAGGGWGSEPPQILLEPYPTSTVVAAAENHAPQVCSSVGEGTGWPVHAMCPPLLRQLQALSQQPCWTWKAIRKHQTGAARRCKTRTMLWRTSLTWNLG